MGQILVVDDDASVRRLCRIVLQEPGYLVAEASNGKEALAAIKDVAYDLIVLDLCMPGMDGIEFLMAIRAQSPICKIIVMSGFIGGTLLQSMRHLGGSATLAKPFSRLSLLSTVDQVLTQNGT
jgi:CheY-like chemotaxis protein